VGLKRAAIRHHDPDADGFRRTLVGLKRRLLERADEADAFQTNPCGVEADLSECEPNVPVEVSDEPLWG